MAQDISTLTLNTSGGSEAPKKVTGTDVSSKRALDVNVVQTVGGGGGGDATAANQLLEIAQLTAINANTDNLPTALGQTTMAASMPVVIASNQTPVSMSIVDGGNTAAVNVNNELSVSVDNSVLPTDAASDSTLTLAVQALQIMDDWDETNRAAVNLIASQVGVQGGSGAVSANTQRVVLATDVALPAGTNLIGSVTSTPEKSSTATLSNVAASASSVTVLAANASRKKAIFVNDSTVTCRLKCGSTASATSYSIFLARGDTWVEEGPTVYTGIFDAIWDSATGNMRVTEFT